MCKHRGGFPEGQLPIVLDTLRNAEYNIKYLKKQFTIYYRSTIMNIHYGRTLSDASMLYFADVFFIFFYGRLSWPNG